MKENFIHLLAILVHAASWFDVIEQPKPPTPAPVVTVCQCGCGKAGCVCNVASKSCTPKPAVQPSAEAIQPVVTLWTFPGCGPCESLKKELAGIQGVTVKTIVETGPYTHANYPVLTMDGRSPLVGLRTRAAVEAWMQGR